MSMRSRRQQQELARDAAFCQARRMPRFRTTFLAMVTVTSAMAVAHAAPQTYRFDPVHTQVWFSTSHEKFSHPQGRIRIANGWFQFDPDDWTTARVDVVLDLATLDLGDRGWNEAVKSNRFLDVGQWPSAHYVSRSVEKTGTNRGVIHGDLKLHGMTAPVDVAFTLNGIGYDVYAISRKAGFSGSATLSRSRFGMTAYPKVVGDEVSVHLEIEGEPERSTATHAAGSH